VNEQVKGTRHQRQVAAAVAANAYRAQCKPAPTTRLNPWREPTAGILRTVPRNRGVRPQ